MEIGIKKAISVPLNLAKKLTKLWEPIKELAYIMNISTKSDLQVLKFIINKNKKISNICSY